VVWATSRHVGCAYHLCKPLAGLGSAYSSALYLVCNYGPAGNYGGEKPYKKGAACSRCGSGAGWCTDRLCNRDCAGARQGCKMLYGLVDLNFGELRADSATHMTRVGYKLFVNYIFFFH